MSAPEHSQLPWRIMLAEPAAIKDANGKSVAIMRRFEDVQLIIAAVNSHAALLAAAKRVISEWQCASEELGSAMDALYSAIAAAEEPEAS